MLARKETTIAERRAGHEYAGHAILSMIYILPPRNKIARCMLDDS